MDKKLLKAISDLTRVNAEINRLEIERAKLQRIIAACRKTPQSTAVCTVPPLE